MGALLRGVPVMLATPHAAFAIGLVFLIAPSGWLLRALSPWLTGFEWPPAWPTTQDPWGLGLILALTAKEIPFLLWTAATQLQRDDVRQRWRAEHTLAQTLGYAPHRAWWRVVWPQLAPRLFWPLLAVLAYGLTVVDMALVIGPASPPTLAVLAWQWLQDADLAVNARGCGRRRCADAGGVGRCTGLARRSTPPPQHQRAARQGPDNGFGRSGRPVVAGRVVRRRVAGPGRGQFCRRLALSGPVARSADHAGLGQRLGQPRHRGHHPGAGPGVHRAGLVVVRGLAGAEPPPLGQRLAPPALPAAGLARGAVGGGAVQPGAAHPAGRPVERAAAGAHGDGAALCVARALARLPGL